MEVVLTDREMQATHTLIGILGLNITPWPERRRDSLILHFESAHEGKRIPLFDIVLDDSKDGIGFSISVGHTLQISDLNRECRKISEVFRQ